MFHVQCPLGHTLEVEPAHVGERLFCPICQAVVYAGLPKPGQLPTAKYEVQCSQGHILRVKQKYLDKEVRCPACQEMVSMKPAMLLTVSGMTLGVAAPQLIAKLAKPKKKKAKPKPPAPPTGVSNVPLVPEVVESLDFVPPQRPGKSSGQTIPDYDNLELEIVDTQLKIDMGAQAAPTASGPRTPRLPDTSSGRIPAPPPRKPSLEEVQRLSESDLVKIQQAPSVPSEDIEVTCPNGHILAIERQYEGQHVQCPLCQAVLQVPTQPSVED
jgi:hypothetical protein